MRRKKRRRIGPIILLALGLLASIALLLFQYVFVVRHVDVVGNGSFPAQDVVRLSGIRFGGRLGAVNAEKVTESVQSDGRLAFVSLETRLPNRVVLTVRQRSQDALILQAGKVLVLDSDGYVVSVGDRLPAQSMPYVTGLKPSTYQLGRQLDAADGRLNAMKAVLEALKAQGATGYVSELSVDNTADLRITTRTGMQVLLGDAGNMNSKVVWMVGTLADLEARGETVGRLDVSSGNKADFLSYATPTPAPTPVPTPDPYAISEGPLQEGEALIGEDAI